MSPERASRARLGLRRQVVVCNLNLRGLTCTPRCHHSGCQNASVRQPCPSSWNCPAPTHHWGFRPHVRGSGSSDEFKTGPCGCWGCLLASFPSGTVSASSAFLNAGLLPLSSAEAPSFAHSPSPNGPWPRAQAATGLASFVSLLGDHSAVLLFCFLSYNLTTVI